MKKLLIFLVASLLAVPFVGDSLAGNAPMYSAITRTAAGDMTISTADPDLIIDDTDGADGIISVDAGDADDAVMNIGVDDSAGDDTSYIQLDGVNDDLELTPTDDIVLNPGGLGITIGDNGNEDYTIVIDSDTNNLTINWDEDNAELELTSEGDEDLVIDLDTATDNEVGISSSTGTTQLNFGSLGLVTTGGVLGALKRVDVDSTDADDSYTISAADGYGLYITNKGDDDALTIVLPDCADGMHVCVALYAAQDVNIDPTGEERIMVDTDTNGDYLSSDATVGSAYCVVGVSATEWMPMFQTGTWTEEAP